MTGARTSAAQRPFRLDAFLPYQLSITSNAVSATIARAYRARFGLKIPEWRLLAVLAEEQGLTPAALVARTEMDKMTVSRASAALEARGLVERARHGDQRSHLLVLTNAGRELYREIVPLAIATEARLLAALNDGDRAALSALLAKLKAATGGA